MDQRCFNGPKVYVTFKDSMEKRTYEPLSNSENLGILQKILPSLLLQSKVGCTDGQKESGCDPNPLL